jgi:riboflavin biosynthesis pyrimidine reductase
MRTADDCDARLRAIYDPRSGDPHAGGRALDGDVAASDGVLHVTSAGRRAGGGLSAIAIGPRAPRSATDFFLLNVARARADAIVTTGRILRAEPAMSHALQGARGEPEALAAWRRERLGKSEAPLSVVLTSGRAIDFSHPVFRSGTRPLVLTGRTAAADLAPSAASAGVELVARDVSGLRDAVAYLRAECGCATISIEAGPSTARELYAAPLVVDEIMLSVFEESPLPPELDAGPLLDEPQLDRLLPAASPRHVLIEESGAWSFRRLRRR